MIIFHDNLSHFPPSSILPINPSATNYGLLTMFRPFTEVPKSISVEGFDFNRSKLEDFDMLEILGKQ